MARALHGNVAGRFAVIKERPQFGSKRVGAGTLFITGMTFRSPLPLSDLACFLRRQWRGPVPVIRKLHENPR